MNPKTIPESGLRPAFFVSETFAISRCIPVGVNSATMKMLIGSLPFLLAFCLFGAPAASAQDADIYRVEVLVFTHAGGQSDAWPETGLESHAEALDPALAASSGKQQNHNEEDPDLAAALHIMDTLASFEDSDRPFGEVLVLPETWVALDTLTEPAEAARQKLVRSGAFDLLAWSAWYQPVESGRSAPTVRVHDDHLLSVSWVSLSPTGRITRNGKPVTRAGDLFPEMHYRLDGTVRLRRQRHVHADINLAWRIPEQPPETRLFTPLEKITYLTHHLDESRAIRSNRFEYFDSGWLGVLLHVTPWLAPEEEDENAE